MYICYHTIIMPYFFVLCIKEHVENKPNILDNKVYIIYDPTDEQYFCYGSRNNGNDVYEKYSMTYNFGQVDSLVYLLFFAMNKFDSKITVELYSLFIEEDDYDSLDYYWFYNTIDKHFEMSAYDKEDMSIDYMSALLNMLVTG